MLTAGGEMATQESLGRERRMVTTINDGIGTFEALGRAHAFVASEGLRAEQKTAVLAVLETRDLAFNLRGAAGTGKTATLQELHRELREARRSVVAVEPITVLQTRMLLILQPARPARRPTLPGDWYKIGTKS